MINQDNAWAFGVYAYLQPDDVAAHKKIAAFTNLVEQDDDWLQVWLLVQIGEVDKAATKLQYMLKSGWLPNHQEILFPIERDPVSLPCNPAAWAKPLLSYLKRTENWRAPSVHPVVLYPPGLSRRDGAAKASDQTDNRVKN
jgi:hypothetical protein